MKFKTKKKRIALKHGVGVLFAWLLTLALVTGMLPSVSARAAVVKEGITFVPMEYDMENQTLKIKVSTEVEDCSLAYYIYQRSVTGSMTLEEMFAVAEKTGEKDMELICPTQDPGDSRNVTYLYVWNIDKEGNPISRTNYMLDMTRILADEDMSGEDSIHFVNGNPITEEDFQMICKNGIWEWSLNEEIAQRYGNVFCWNRLYRDGKAVAGMEGSSYYDSREYINETGDYELRCGVVAITGNKSQCISKAFCVPYHYTKPERELDYIPFLSLVSMVEGTNENAIKFSLEEYEDFEDLSEIRITCTPVTADGQRMNRRGTSVKVDGKGRTFQTTVALSWFSVPDATYEFSMRLLSKDIEKVASSQEFICFYYDPSQKACDVTDALAEAIEQLGIAIPDELNAESLNALFEKASEEEKPEMAKTLKEALASLQSHELKFAMQTSSNVLQIVEAIESMQGVEVDTSVSDEVQNIVDSESITVTGAGLNADEGVSHVSLDLVSVPEELLHQWNVNGFYSKNAVSLGITLTGCSKAASGLAIPVQVSMTIPKGVNMGKLQILHLGADGNVEEVLQRGSGYILDYRTRTVTFTVTHFSTFVFAEPADENTGDDGAPGNSGSENETPGGTETSGDENETPGGTETPGDENDSKDSDFAEDDFSANGFVKAVDVDWNTVQGNINSAKAGENTNVLTGKSFQVPVNVIGALAGTEKVLALQLGNGTSVSISGKDIKKVGKAFEITMAEEAGIPEAVKRDMQSSAAIVREFAIEDENLFPYRANIHFSFGEENAGKTAYLYRYDVVSKTMRPVGSFQITRTGQAMFGMDRGGKYLVTTANGASGITGGNPSGTAGGYTVVKGDTIYRIAVRNGISQKELLKANPQITDADKIYPGQKLNLR